MTCKSWNVLNARYSAPSLPSGLIYPNLCHACVSRDNFLHGVHASVTPPVSFSSKVPKVFVFFTDGTNTDGEDLTVFTRQLEEKGIKTLAIGVGSDTNPDELTTIASGSKDNVFRIEEFEELKLVIQELITALCPRWLAGASDDRRWVSPGCEELCKSLGYQDTLE